MLLRRIGGGVLVGALGTFAAGFSVHAQQPVVQEVPSKPVEAERAPQEAAKEHKAHAGCRHEEDGGRKHRDHKHKEQHPLWDDDWDKRHQQYQEARKEGRKLPTRHLLLIRHGQYHYTDDPATRLLTDLGIQQANVTADRLAAFLAGKNLVALHSSTMPRAIQTAQSIAAKLPAELPWKKWDVLCEGFPVVPVPYTPKRKPWEEWEDGPVIEGAFRKFFHRSLETVQDGKEDEYEVIVCHANVIRFFVLRALQLEPKAWLRLSHHHCGITWVKIPPNGKVSLRAYGDAGHLPPEFMTTS